MKVIISGSFRKHLKENDEHIKILFEKNEICLTEDTNTEDLDKIKLKK